MCCPSLDAFSYIFSPAPLKRSGEKKKKDASSNKLLLSAGWALGLCKPSCIPRKFCKNILLLLIVAVLAGTGSALWDPRSLLPGFWSTRVKSEPNKSQWEVCLWLHSSQGCSPAVPDTGSILMRRAHQSLWLHLQREKIIPWAVSFLIITKAFKKLSSSTVLTWVT